MIVSFADSGTEDVYNGRRTKAGLRTCPVGIWKVAWRKLDQLNQATSLADLKVPPGNRLEALAGDREGQFSIRINEQYRLCFVWVNNGAKDVRIEDYH